MFKQHQKALIFAISGKSVVSLDQSTVPTTQHAAPGSSIKLRHNCSGTGIPAIGIAPTGFTENSGLVLIIFMQE